MNLEAQSPDRHEDDAQKQPQPESAGNAIYDPANQTQRLDAPASSEEKTQGELLRGTAPSSNPDESHQPQRDDHRSNQDSGTASQSGKRQST
jgi:hypothetical protein